MRRDNSKFFLFFDYKKSLTSQSSKNRRFEIHNTVTNSALGKRTRRSESSNSVNLTKKAQMEPFWSSNGYKHNQCVHCKQPTQRGLVVCPLHLTSRGKGPKTNCEKKKDSFLQNLPLAILTYTLATHLDPDNLISLITTNKKGFQQLRYVRELTIGGRDPQKLSLYAGSFPSVEVLKWKYRSERSGQEYAGGPPP